MNPPQYPTPICQLGDYYYLDGSHQEPSYDKVAHKWLLRPGSYPGELLYKEQYL